MSRTYELSVGPDSMRLDIPQAGGKVDIEVANGDSVCVRLELHHDSKVEEGELDIDGKEVICNGHECLSVKTASIDFGQHEAPEEMKTSVDVLGDVLRIKVKGKEDDEEPPGELINLGGNAYRVVDDDKDPDLHMAMKHSGIFEKHDKGYRYHETKDWKNDFKKAKKAVQEKISSHGRQQRVLVLSSCTTVKVFATVELEYGKKKTPAKRRGKKQDADLVA